MGLYIPNSRRLRQYRRNRDFYAEIATDIAAVIALTGVMLTIACWSILAISYLSGN